MFYFFWMGMLGMQVGYGIVFASFHIWVATATQRV